MRNGHKEGFQEAQELGKFLWKVFRQGFILISGTFSGKFGGNLRENVGGKGLKDATLHKENAILH